MPQNGDGADCSTYRWGDGSDGRMALVYRKRIGQDAPTFEVMYKDGKGKPMRKLTVCGSVSEVHKLINSL